MLGELSISEIETVLTHNVVGRIGVQCDGKVYIVPITDVYELGTVYGHTTEGKKIELLRKSPECCFEVDEIKTIANWQSVIAWGRFEELQGSVQCAGKDFNQTIAITTKRNKLCFAHGTNLHWSDIYLIGKLNCLSYCAYREVGPL